MKSSFCIDLQRFMLIPTKFPLTPSYPYKISNYACKGKIIISEKGTIRSKY